MSIFIHVTSAYQRHGSKSLRLKRTFDSVPLKKFVFSQGLGLADSILLNSKGLRVRERGRGRGL